MAHIRDDIRMADPKLPPDFISELEQSLCPTYECISFQHLTQLEDEPYDSAHALDSAALGRSFQHAALVYLYRVFCGLPSGDFLVQQHVRSAIDCIAGMGQPSKVKKCTLFPLLVAGAHALSPNLRRRVKDGLDEVYGEIRFECVNVITTELQSIWGSDRQSGSWSDIFEGLNPDILVL